MTADTHPEPQEAPTDGLREQIHELVRRAIVDSDAIGSRGKVLEKETDALMELVQQHVEQRTNKCKGCDKITSYCANCERLLQT